MSVSDSWCLSREDPRGWEHHEWPCVLNLIAICSAYRVRGLTIGDGVMTILQRPHTFGIARAGVFPAGRGGPPDGLLQRHQIGLTMNIQAFSKQLPPTTWKRWHCHHISIYLRVSVTQ